MIVSIHQRGGVHLNVAWSDSIYAFYYWAECETLVFLAMNYSQPLSFVLPLVKNEKWAWMLADGHVFLIAKNSSGKEKWDRRFGFVSLNEWYVTFCKLFITARMAAMAWALFYQMKAGIPLVQELDFS